MIGIYKITNPVGQVYVGQSIDIKNRWNCHKSKSDAGIKRLHHSFLKYGVLNHKFEVITECLKSELDSLERFYQLVYNKNGGLNSHLQADIKISDRLNSEYTLKAKRYFLNNTAQ